MRGIKFILVDGEVECTEETLRSLKSDMIDRMLDSEMKMSTEMELDFELATFNACVESSKRHQPDHTIWNPVVRMDVIRLADFLQMTDVARNHCARLAEVVKIRNWPVEVAMIAVANRVRLPTTGGVPREDLVDFIFEGWPASHIHHLTSATDYQQEIQNAVCQDPRCTFEVFAEYYNGSLDSRTNYKFVEKGWLDAKSVLKLSLKLSLSIERPKIRSLGGKPLAFDVLTPIARVNGAGLWSKLTRYYHDAELIKHYEVWDDRDQKCIVVISGDHYKYSTPAQYGKHLMHHVVLYAVY